MELPFDVIELISFFADSDYGAFILTCKAFYKVRNEFRDWLHVKISDGSILSNDGDKQFKFFKYVTMLAEFNPSILEDKERWDQFSSEASFNIPSFYPTLPWDFSYFNYFDLTPDCITSNPHIKWDWKFLAQFHKFELPKEFLLEHIKEPLQTELIRGCGFWWIDWIFVKENLDRYDWSWNKLHKELCCPSWDDELMILVKRNCYEECNDCVIYSSESEESD